MDWKYEDGRIYSINEDGQLMAEATYSTQKNGEVNINHTYVNPILRGQGVAGKMMQVVAQFLREKNLKATATCSYANNWLKKHKEDYPEIVSKDLEDETVACKIDGKH